MAKEIKRPQPFNPLEKRHLAEAVADALLKSEPSPLPLTEPFVGAGVYAIYYRGDFKPYRPLAQEKVPVPIYVGKAIPAGSRRGGFGLGENPGLVLYNRINEHAETIGLAAKSLRLRDFRCQYLVTEDIWIPLAESLLIHKFHPLWNRVIDGFGNHDPGAGRYNQQRSAWDTLHPGRGWAERCVPYARSEADIAAAVAKHFKKSP